MIALGRAATAVALTAGLLVGSSVPAQAARPTHPVITSIKTTADTATVAWRSTGATYYRVCLRRGIKDATCTADAGKITTSSFTFRGLTARTGVDYHVSVTAYSPDGQASSPRQPFDLPNVVRPAAPTSIKTKVTPSTATVTWPAAKNATSYDLCLTRSKAEKGCWRTTPRSGSRSVKVNQLVPTSGADYFFVVRAYRSGVITPSKQQRFDLPVSRTRDVALRSTASTRLRVTWSPTRNAETYRVEYSLSPSMKSSRSVTATSTSVDLSGLQPGKRYHVRVRPQNLPVTGSYTAAVTRGLPTQSAALRVVTYNLCGQDKCRSTRNSATVPKWSARKKAAGALVRGTGSGIVSTQESGDKDTNFITQLPGFKRAAYRSAKSLFYDTARYEMTRSGPLTLDSARNRYAVWAELVDKATGTPVIVVDPHLEPGKGRTNDVLREAQTQRMLSQVAALNTEDLPVVYAGDYNSNKDNADQKKYPGGYDAVRKAFTAADVVDSLAEATRVGAARDANYNTANQGIVTPIRNGDHVDAIYVERGIQVTGWRNVVDLVTPTRYVTPFASDHNPVTADLVVPGLKDRP